MRRWVAIEQRVRRRGLAPQRGESGGFGAHKPKALAAKLPNVAALLRRRIRMSDGRGGRRAQRRLIVSAQPLEDGPADRDRLRLRKQREVRRQIWRDMHVAVVRDRLGRALDADE